MNEIALQFKRACSISVNLLGPRNYRKSLSFINTVSLFGCLIVCQRSNKIVSLRTVKKLSALR